MDWYIQKEFDVCLEWGLPAVEYLADSADCAIIVDVMSFSTCVSLANDRRALVYPYTWKDSSAKEYGDRLGALTASADRRFTEDGFSLSPQSVSRISSGEKLVLPSPNGSAISFRARDSAIAVFSGCFRNITATANACRHFKRILVIPCGEHWPDGRFRPAVEDYVAAGGIIAALARSPSPEAAAALASWDQSRAQHFKPLFACSSAQELIARGFAADVDLCLEVNGSVHANQLRGNAYQAV